MGLDTSHGCWHGAYSAFSRWRQKIAEVAGLPPLELMEGFFDPARYGTLHFGQLDNDEDDIWTSKRRVLQSKLPIKWECLKPSPLHELLYHSDCDGDISWQSCTAIADALEALLPKLPDGDGGGHIGIWRGKTQTFIDGLRLAAREQENVDFH